MSYLLESRDANDKDKLSDSYLEFVTCKTYISRILRVTAASGWQVLQVFSFQNTNDASLINRMNFVSKLFSMRV